jgi:hypothetical protein
MAIPEKSEQPFLFEDPPGHRSQIRTSGISNQRQQNYF